MSGLDIIVLVKLGAAGDRWIRWYPGGSVATYWNQPRCMAYKNGTQNDEWAGCSYHYAFCRTSV
jgi:hypothetical protein